MYIFDMDEVKGTENMHCCSFDECQFRRITTSDGRVEVRASVPKGGFSKLQEPKVKWRRNGDAVFHRDCWDLVVKTCRMRSKKRAPFVMSAAEKTLVKEALKTAEFHDSLDTLANEASRIADLIKNAEHCVAFTGAGISTSAGIGDYRGKSGKWTEEDRGNLNTEILNQGDEPKQKKARTEDVSGTHGNVDNDDDSDNGKHDNGVDDGVPYEELRPTYTHEALCKLVQLGLIKHIISQNGDGLHGLSGIPSTNLSELHGNVFIEKCEKCGTRYERSFYVLDDHASLYYEELNDLGATTVKKPRHAKRCDLCGLCHRTSRKCKRKGCKGHLIDSIINFRDNLEEDIFHTAQEHAAKCDLMLCLGTTMTVSPANELVEMGKQPLRIVVCNR